MPKNVFGHVIDLAVLAMLPAASGLTIRNNASTPDTSADIVADFAVLIAGTDVGKTYLASGVDLEVNTTTTGVNGLDTGSRAANTWYRLWLIWGANEDLAGLASLSATAPTMPAGYTHKLRVGAKKTDGSGNLVKAVQRGNVVHYGVNVILGQGTAGSIGSPTWVAVNVSSSIAPTAARILGLLRILGSSVNIAAMAAPNNTFGSIDTGANFPPISVAANSGSSVGVYISEFDFALESQNIYWASNAAVSGSNGAILACRGYVDSVNAS